jgi:hypothetical protein
LATLHFEDKAYYVYVLCKISLWQVSVCQKVYNLYWSKHCAIKC